MKFIKEVMPYVVIFISVMLIRTFIITPVIVSGSSMDSTLKDGEILILKKYDKTYERFDIIVFDYNDSKLVKRVIGLPGEKVKYIDGKLYINEEEVSDPFASLTHDYELDITIPDNYYFVLGDNRTNSTDSRLIGLIDEKDINGTTNFSLWPIKRVK